MYSKGNKRNKRQKKIERDFMNLSLISDEMIVIQQILRNLQSYY